MNSRFVDNSFVPTAVPTPRQLEYQSWEMGIFFHFGIRTFFEGHRDWDGKPMPTDGFRPAALDCNDWIENAKRAGMKYAVLVTKHHDGFANWPSKFSDYTVAQTPWKDGEGDVVREFVDACRAHDFKIGFYYSPAEWGTPIFDDAKAYDDHFINQASELMSNYGEIDMLWFDGCGSGDHEYDWARIIGEIRRRQPDLLVFGMGDPDYTWVGNEDGWANLPNWNTSPASRVFAAIESVKTGPPLWLPNECDCKMRWENWFYSDDDEWTVKPLEVLMGMYYLSVGRGSNILLNIGPDRRGLLPDKDRERLLEFGDEIRRRFGQPIATMADGKVTETGWECDFEKVVHLDHVTLQEDLTEGEAVREFAIHVHNGGMLITVYKGQNIGHKAICRFPLLAVEKIIVEIIESDRPARLSNVELHNTCGTIYEKPSRPISSGETLSESG